MGTKDTITVIDNNSGQEFECPIEVGTHGPPVVDIQCLRELGYFTHDPGFITTSSCRSAITFIDGDKGILLYRGYPIEQLAENSSYLEVCYLLLYGELPDHKAWEKFNGDIRRHTMIPRDVPRLLAATLKLLSGLLTRFSARWVSWQPAREP